MNTEINDGKLYNFDFKPPKKLPDNK